MIARRMEEKTYTLACHGCGTIHEHRAMFLSSPLAVSVLNADGKEITLGCYACSDCQKPENGHRIKDAFNHGMSPAAHERLKAEGRRILRASK